jgi:demethylmenaquinone methyltransferase/2-methoxy-6-polyprenyl-1,4-benzoquinol methylase
MDNLNNYATTLYLSNFLREPLVRMIISTLNLPQGSMGVDIGYGIGSNTLILVEAVGKSRNVVGIDKFENLIYDAKKRAENEISRYHSTGGVSWIHMISVVGESFLKWPKLH